MSNKKRLLNDEIRAKRVQVITEDWENLGNMSMNEARDLASKKQMDIMEMWRNWDLTIVKILDYWKYLYRQKKLDQKNKSKWKSPDLKTIRITFKIWEHDLQTRIKQAVKFAEQWNPLKLTLMLRWRENCYWDLAQEKMETFVGLLEDYYKIDSPIKKSWNIFVAMLKPKPVSQKDIKN